MALVKLLLSLAVAVSLAAEPVHALYESSPNVKLLSPANFDRVLSKTSQPTFVEFYAPWCGHCQKLQSEYEQAAKRALGIAKFYAVDCDNESNRGLCARFSVQGFPTIKVFTEKRTKRGNRKSVDYQGERSARAMVRYARSILPNFSKKLSADGLDVFIANSSRLPKAVLLTERAKTSDLWKGLSALFSNQVDFAQISNPEQQTLERFGVTELPTVVAFSAITDPSQFEIYKGEIKYLPLAKFIKNVSTG
ncbi:thioredoxin-like protein, partial [Coemansia spiralis]